MPYYRRLPSGLWQATVRSRDGRRHTFTDPLKSAVKRWAGQQEAAIARGEFRDPRLGEMKIGDWHARVTAARGTGEAAKAKNASLWRIHCEPQWARWPLGAVARLEAQEWANRLSGTRRARHRGSQGALSAETVTAIVHVMSSLYRLAVREQLVTVNPFEGLELPAAAVRPVQFYERAEAAALYGAAGRWRTLIELGMDVGLRPGELFGLHGHRVDWLRGRLEVVDVMTRQGLRQWPKSKKSHRAVPVPAVTLEGMAALMSGRPRDSLVFTGADGGPVTDEHFRRLVWYPAVKAAGIRRFPPRIMRHTAASWLVQDGVPLYDVQALLGHEDYATTCRYAHLAPGAHGKVTESWERRRTGEGLR